MSRKRQEFIPFEKTPVYNLSKFINRTTTIRPEMNVFLLSIVKEKQKKNYSTILKTLFYNNEIIIKKTVD